MKTTQAAVYQQLLETVTSDTLTMARAVPAERLYRQLAPGKATPLWIVGHLANTLDRTLIGWILGEPRHLTEEASRPFAPGYAGGIAPSTDPTLYPPYDVLLERYERLAAYVTPRVGELTAEQLAAPPVGDVPESRRSIFPTTAIALQRLAAHDAYHRGQLAMLVNLPADA